MPEMIETKYVVVEARGGLSIRTPDRHGNLKEAGRAFRANPRAKYIEKMTVVNYSTSPKIREAQLRREKDVLDNIKTLNRNGMLYSPVLPSVAWWHAMDRLEAKGLIRYYRTKICWGARGYLARGFLVRRGQLYRVNYERDPFPKKALHALWAKRLRWGIPGMFGKETLIGEATSAR